MSGGSSAAKQPALGMLLHAAGTLQDGMLASQNLPRLRAVLAAKLGAMQGVSSRLPSIPLERLVLFSSVASLLGTAGQANYAAANAGLDAWAADAGSSGLWAVSLQWAAWASSGRSPSIVPFPFPAGCLGSDGRLCLDYIPMLRLRQAMGEKLIGLYSSAELMAGSYLFRSVLDMTPADPSSCCNALMPDAYTRHQWFCWC